MSDHRDKNISARLFTAAALSVCSWNYLQQHRLQCKREGKGGPEMEWLLSNRTVPSLQRMSDSDLTCALHVLAFIEHTMSNRYDDSCGPFNLLMGM